MTNKKRSPAEIRQQGFNEHAQGFRMKNNPWTIGEEAFDLWVEAEGWMIRERQMGMFGSGGLDENVSFDSFAECPHCGMKVKVTLASE